MPESIKQIMREVKTINSKTTFFDAIKKMIEEETNSLVVVGDAGEVKGVINAGELIREVVPDYLEEDDAVAAHFANREIFVEEVNRAKDTALEKFMIKNPVTIKYSDSLMEAAVLAISSRQFRIPVVDEENKPVGIITRTELKRVIGEILGIKSF